MNKPLYANQLLTKGARLPAASCYLFWGEDSLAKTRLERLARQQSLAKGSEDFDLAVFYGADSRAEDILEQLDMLPMLSAKRVVVVRAADELRADDAKRLAPYLESPGPQTVIVLTAGKIDQRKTFWKNALASSLSVRCTPPYEPRDIEMWLRGETGGYTFDADALSLFASSIELDYEIARQEWEKLVLYVGDRRRVNVRDVEESLGQLRTHSVYELQDALGSRNLRRAMTSLESILAGGESPIFVVTVLMRFYLTIWRIQVLRKRGADEQEVRRSAMPGVIPRFQDRYLRAAATIPARGMMNIFAALYDADDALKSTGDHLDRFLAEIMVWRLCKGV